MNTPNVIFAGTPDFAVASLMALVDSGVIPIAVLTQPDRRAGRGKRLSKSPVKKVAEKLGIPVLNRKPCVMRALSQSSRHCSPTCS